jgi:hypothetical protein
LAKQQTKSLANKDLHQQALILRGLERNELIEIEQKKTRSKADIVHFMHQL